MSIMLPSPRHGHTRPHLRQLCMITLTVAPGQAIAGSLHDVHTSLILGEHTVLSSSLRSRVLPHLLKIERRVYMALVEALVQGPQSTKFCSTGDLPYHPLITAFQDMAEVDASIVVQDMQPLSAGLERRAALSGCEPSSTTGKLGTCINRAAIDAMRNKLATHSLTIWSQRCLARTGPYRDRDGIGGSRPAIRSLLLDAMP
jgi:hypothetical protein